MLCSKLRPLVAACLVSVVVSFVSFYYRSKRYGCGTDFIFNVLLYIYTFMLLQYRRVITLYGSMPVQTLPVHG